MKRLFGIAAFALALAAMPAANATPIHFTATLDGASEDPPNASTGTGTADVWFDPVAHTMTVDATFSGLVAATLASHIHCCTAAPLTGTAGVASEVPSFSTFPLGVTSGSFSQVYDLTDLASFNPSFVTANGGTAAGAEAALWAGLSGGMAYLNIHTDSFPGGEIRGFLTQAPDVPEPATLALLGLGVAGAFAARRLRKN